MPLFWTIFSETWWNRPGHKKSDPELQRTWSGLELRRNDQLYVQPKKCIFFQKHLKFLKRLIFIWEKVTFFFEQLFPVVAKTWLELRSESFFLGPKSRFLVQKSIFCHTTPILVNDPFLALGMTVNFPPWDRFFDFLFRSYSCFRARA